VLGISFLLFEFPSYYTDYATYLFTYTFNYTRLLPEWQGNPLFTHLWSLCIEEQFYLFFPLVVFLLKPRAVRAFLVLFIILSPLTRYLLGEYYGDRASPIVAADAVYWHTLSHLDAFFMGGIIPVFRLDQKIRKPYRLFLIAGLIAIFSGIAYYFSYGSTGYFTNLGYSHDEVEGYAHVWRYTVLNLFFASLLLVVTLKENKWLQKWFGHPLLVRIGRVSYGMYIFHWLVYVYLFQRLYAPESIWLKLLMFLPYLAAVYAIAELSFRFYESWFIRMKDVWFGRSKSNGSLPDEGSVPAP
jgi:peptidoglycan/LPS O-acetylase OafA/YrhL